MSSSANNSDIQSLRQTLSRGSVDDKLAILAALKNGSLDRDVSALENSTVDEAEDSTSVIIDIKRIDRLVDLIDKSETLGAVTKSDGRLKDELSGEIERLEVDLRAYIRGKSHPELLELQNLLDRITDENIRERFKNYTVRELAIQAKENKSNLTADTTIDPELPLQTDQPQDEFGGEITGVLAPDNNTSESKLAEQAPKLDSAPPDNFQVNPNKIDRVKEVADLSDDATPAIEDKASVNTADLPASDAAEVHDGDVEQPVVPAPAEVAAKVPRKSIFQKISNAISKLKKEKGESLTTDQINKLIGDN